MWEVMQRLLIFARSVTVRYTHKQRPFQLSPAGSAAESGTLGTGVLPVEPGVVTPARPRSLSCLQLLPRGRCSGTGSDEETPNALASRKTSVRTPLRIQSGQGSLRRLCPTKQSGRRLGRPRHCRISPSSQGPVARARLSTHCGILAQRVAGSEPRWRDWWKK